MCRKRGGARDEEETHAVDEVAAVVREALGRLDGDHLEQLRHAQVVVDAERREDASAERVEEDAERPPVDRVLVRVAGEHLGR